MALFPKASGGGESSYHAESDYRTLSDADAISRDKDRHGAALAHGKSQQDTFGRLSGGKSKSKRAAGKPRGFTPAMRGLSGGHR